MSNIQQPGQVRKAPENFVDAQGVRTVFSEARKGRRDFIRGAFAAAVAGGAATSALAQVDGDPAILQLPAHSTGLGRCSRCSASSRPAACTSSVITRAGGTSILRNTA